MTFSNRLLRLLGLAVFAIVAITLEVGAFPGPWVWNRSQVLLVLLVVVIVGLAIARRAGRKSGDTNV